MHLDHELLPSSKTDHFLIQASFSLFSCRSDSRTVSELILASEPAKTKLHVFAFHQPICASVEISCVSEFHDVDLVYRTELHYKWVDKSPPQRRLSINLRAASRRSGANSWVFQRQMWAIMRYLPAHAALYQPRKFAVKSMVLTNKMAWPVVDLDR